MNTVTNNIYDSGGKLLYCYTEDLVVLLNKLVSIHDMIRKSDPPEFIAGALYTLDKLNDIINNPDNFINNEPD